MTLRGLLGAFWRRWYLLLVGLLLTAGLVMPAAQAAPPQHRARALILLLPSETMAAEGGNPLLEVSGLDFPGRVLVAYFSSETALRQIEALAPEAEVSVEMDESTRGPVLAVDVLDATPESALATRDYMTEQIPIQLARIQIRVGAPLKTRVRSIPLTVDGEATVDYGKFTRLTIAAGTLGLAATGFSVTVLDAWLLDRRRRREARALPVEDP